jgi:hypothetical protein
VIESNLSCAEFKELVPGYALAALDEVEQTACARHLELAGPHEGCAEAVVEVRMVTARLVAALPLPAPPPQLWQAIEARLRAMATEPVVAAAWVREMTVWAILATIASSPLALLR